MMRARSGSSVLALALGALLLVEGVWGLSGRVVFGFITTSPLQAVLNLALGAAGVVAGLRGSAREYLRYAGALLVAVGIARVVPFVGDLVVRMLNLNYAGALLGIVVGLTCLAVASTVNAPGRIRRTAA